MPQYPRYPSQPFTGQLPSMPAMGPSDLRASSGTSPHNQRITEQAHGRRLAGIGEVMDEDSEPAWATNEVEYYAEMDDVQGSGVFDPPGTQPNNYPDAGILADRFSKPGYLARERMYAESEVRDVTTGRPVVYVNGGAVAMDSAAQVAFIERNLYDPPVPVLNQAAHTYVGFRDTSVERDQPAQVTPLPSPTAQPPYSIVPPAPQAGLGQESGMSAGKMLAITAAVALAAGAAYAMLRPKKGK